MSFSAPWTIRLAGWCCICLRRRRESCRSWRAICLARGALAGFTIALKTCRAWESTSGGCCCSRPAGRTGCGDRPTQSRPVSRRGQPSRPPLAGADGAALQGGREGGEAVQAGRSVVPPGTAPSSPGCGMNCSRIGRSRCSATGRNCWPRAGDRQLLHTPGPPPGPADGRPRCTGPCEPGNDPAARRRRPPGSSRGRLPVRRGDAGSRGVGRPTTRISLGSNDPQSQARRASELPRQGRRPLDGGLHLRFDEGVQFSLFVGRQRSAAITGRPPAAPPARRVVVADRQ